MPRHVRVLNNIQSFGIRTDLPIMSIGLSWTNASTGRYKSTSPCLEMTPFYLVLKLITTQHVSWKQWGLSSKGTITKALSVFVP